MVLFVTVMFFIGMLLFPGVNGGHPLNKLYYKLSENQMDQLYFRLLQSGSANSRLMCAMHCNIDEMCTLLKFQDGQCELFKEQTTPGIGSISLTGVLEVWKYIGKAIITLGMLRKGREEQYLSKQFIKLRYPSCLSPRSVNHTPLQPL